MKAYSYSREGILNGSFELKESDKDPMNTNEYLLPLHSTLIKPPPKKKNKTLKFKDEGWVFIPDFSGVDYYNKKTAEKKNFLLGEEFDSSYTEIKPENQFQIFNNETKTWIESPELKKQKEIDNARDILTQTDWYITRLNDPTSGEKIPDEIILQRKQAREKLKEFGL
jgi:hypothetical protein